MSTRGINFLDKWMAEQLPENVSDDPIVISDLADKAVEAADKAGISAREISEEVPSVFEVIAEAMDHREGGTPLTSAPVAVLASFSLRAHFGLP